MDEVSYSILKNAYLSLQEENEQLKFQLDNAPLGVLDTYKQALQEIREYAIDLIDGAAGGCEPDIGTILLKRINEVIGGDNG